MDHIKKDQYVYKNYDDWDENGRRFGTICLPNGLLEERVKVDRKKLQAMINGETPEIGSAEDFFKRIMINTKTDITWPTKLRLNTKTKKDPHVRIIGTLDAINSAKEEIIVQLDSRRNRVTVKMDVAFTDHSHIIGKGGRSIQRVMDETGCHIHFPDSNRTSTLSKSNQVSIAGTAVGVEQARCRIRKLLPIIFMIDVPVNAIQPHALDFNSSTLQSIQQAFGLTVTMRISGKHNFSEMAILTISVRGTRLNINSLKHGINILLEYLIGTKVNLSSFPMSINIDIAIHHHALVMGRSNVNIRAIMEKTGASIIFPSEAIPVMSNSFFDTQVTPRNTTVVIKGPSFESAYQAWQELLGYLPMMLVFNLREGQELDTSQITQLMERLHVSINIKSKQKQNIKSIMVSGQERDSRNLFEVRRQLLDLDESEVPFCCDEHAWQTRSKLFMRYLPNYFSQNFTLNTVLQKEVVKEKVDKDGPVINLEKTDLNKQKYFNYQQQQKQAENGKSYLVAPIVIPVNTHDSTSPSSSGNSSGLSSENADICAQKKHVIPAAATSTISTLNETPNKWPIEDERLFPENSKILSKSKVEYDFLRTPNSFCSNFHKSLPGKRFSFDFPRGETANDQTDFNWDFGRESKFCKKSEHVNFFSHSDYYDNLSKDHHYFGRLRDVDFIENSSHIDISILLAQLGLSKYTEIFKDHNIDYETLLRLKDNDLQELGIQYNSRRKLLFAIAEMRKTNCQSTNFEAAPGAERKRKSLLST